jgi:hypothetical protein
VRIKPIVVLITIAAIVAGCRKDAATADQPPASANRSTASAAQPQKDSDVTVRIQKIGGADRKQLVNQIKVTTPIDDEFAVTEQVGATQLSLRGKVIDLKDGQYRVTYDYTETSANGRQELKSLIEMPLNTEKEIGGLLARDGEDGAMETVRLSLSRP